MRILVFSIFFFTFFGCERVFANPQNLLFIYKNQSVDLIQDSKIKSLRSLLDMDESTVKNLTTKKHTYVHSIAQIELGQNQLNKQTYLQSLIQVEFDDEVENLYSQETLLLQYSEEIDLNILNISNEIVQKKNEENDLIIQLENHQLTFDSLVIANQKIINHKDGSVCKSDECTSQVNSRASQYESQRKLIEGQISSISNLVNSIEDQIASLQNQYESYKLQKNNIVDQSIAIGEKLKNLEYMESKNNLEDLKLKGTEAKYELSSHKLTKQLDDVVNTLMKYSDKINQNYFKLNDLIDSTKLKLSKIGDFFSNAALEEAITYSSSLALDKSNIDARLAATDKAIKDIVYNLKHVEFNINKTSFTTNDLNIEVPMIETAELQDYALNFARRIYSDSYIEVFNQNFNAIYWDNYKLVFSTHYDDQLLRFDDIASRENIKFLHALNFSKPIEGGSHRLIFINDHKFVDNLVKYKSLISENSELIVLSSSPLERSELLKILPLELDRNNIDIEIIHSANLDFSQKFKN